MVIGWNINEKTKNERKIKSTKVKLNKLSKGGWDPVRSGLLDRLGMD